MKTELAYAPDGSVTAVQHAWTFDDMDSAFATQGAAAPTNGQFALAELQPLARVNIDSLKEYAYFTYVKIDGRSQKDAFGNPTNYWLEYDSQATVLTLHFTLPFKQPVKARRLTVEIYDPEFFHRFWFCREEPGETLWCTRAMHGHRRKAERRLFLTDVKAQQIVHDVRSQHRDGHEFCQ